MNRIEVEVEICALCGALGDLDECRECGRLCCHTCLSEIFMDPENGVRDYICIKCETEALQEEPALWIS